MNQLVKTMFDELVRDLNNDPTLILHANYENALDMIFILWTEGEKDLSTKLMHLCFAKYGVEKFSIDIAQRAVKTTVEAITELGKQLNNQPNKS